ncbi:hypothetical protein SAMN04487980_1001307 [Streptomyces sp. cf124]|uniref:hypothetical protein n=1 Tax=Streptomyces sp. cf124 TaxID=1761903 RepID=UPI0008E91E65|nr:hypothetical protein [Streptomyces sp. cf124]SFM44030.1 hypothetical protein SAMN04487980_1001307 [Streptomyces sp. cf124]
MGIIVLTEVTKEMGDDYGPGDAVTHPVALYAAPADPDVSGDAADRTVCGRERADPRGRRRASEERPAHRRR